MTNSNFTLEGLEPGDICIHRNGGRTVWDGEIYRCDIVIGDVHFTKTGKKTYGQVPSPFDIVAIEKAPMKKSKTLEEKKAGLSQDRRDKIDSRASDLIQQERARKKRKKKENTYWAGFFGGKVDTIYHSQGDWLFCCPIAVFKTKKEARAIYVDVRKVKIVEVR